jgi:hypothetical protein
MAGVVVDHRDDVVHRHGPSVDRDDLVAELEAAQLGRVLRVTVPLGEGRDLDVVDRGLADERERREGDHQRHHQVHQGPGRREEHLTRVARLTVGAPLQFGLDRGVPGHARDLDVPAEQQGPHAVAGLAARRRPHDRPEADEGVGDDHAARLATMKWPNSWPITITTTAAITSGRAQPPHQASSPASAATPRNKRTSERRSEEVFIATDLRIPWASRRAVASLPNKSSSVDSGSST